MYYVSRQSYYYSGDLVVEVTAGGSDYAGADMLTPKYEGEGEEYADPREAVEAAIAICRQWRRDRRPDDKYPCVAYGSTGGMGIEIEPCTFEYAREQAEKAYEGLPKCARCGDILGKQKFTSDEYGYDPEWSFCSENCVEEDARECAKAREEEGA